MVIKKCGICNKDFVSKSPQSKWCSTKCRDVRRKEIMKKSMNKFRTNKRERFNEIMLNSYYRNKNKWQCRDKTYMMIINNEVDLVKQCKNCKENFNLEIHHEIYPNTKEEILKAINEGKIYFLCRKHHIEIGGKSCQE